jgi:hypothetical protein
VNPYEALRVSYGMLLSADDFRVMINPRGKPMLHSAWLHGSGVVWGFDVCLDGLLALRVSPGLAVDGLGRELSSETTQCLDLRNWLKTYDHPGNQDGCERRTVHACVVAEFGCQLSRPVPTLANPCDITRQHDDFSRVLENASISLRPGDCAARERPYHRVRVLLGLDEVGRTTRRAGWWTPATRWARRRPRSAPGCCCRNSGGWRPWTERGCGPPPNRASRT